jgi:hypothetical protein
MRSNEPSSPGRVPQMPSVLIVPGGDALAIHRVDSAVAHPPAVRGADHAPPDVHARGMARILPTAPLMTAALRAEKSARPNVRNHLHHVGRSDPDAAPRYFAHRASPIRSRAADRRMPHLFHTAVDVSAPVVAARHQHQRYGRRFVAKAVVTFDSGT